MPKKRMNKMLIEGIKNVSYLTVGNIFVMVLSFFGFIAITRILSVDEYGVFKTVTAFIEMFVFLTLNQMNRVIVREGSKDIGRLGGLFRKTLTVKMAAAGLSIIACILAVILFPYSDEKKLLIGLFSFHLIFLTFNGYFFTVYQATMKMKYMVYIRVFQKVAYIAISLGLLLSGMGVIALVIATLISSFVSLFINIVHIRKFVRFKFKRGVIWDPKIMNPTIIFTIILFLGFFTYKVDVLFLSLFVSDTQVGIYGFAQTLIDPGHMLYHNIGIAFFPIIVKIFHTRSMSGRNLMKFSLLMGSLAFLGALVISFFSGDIIRLLNSKYVDSAPIFNILMFTLAFRFMAFPFLNALLATSNEMALLKISWIDPVANIILNYFFLIQFGLIGIAYSTLGVTIIGLITRIIFYISMFRKNKDLNW